MGKAVCGKRLLFGYAGVKHTAKKIIDEVPNVDKYSLWVEPFSGLGRTAEFIKLPKVLNDKSEFANKYCKEHFPNAVVENLDFAETIKKYDSPTTFFLIDPPWRSDIYALNKLSFCDRKVYDYYAQILKIVDNLQGDWFILSSADEHEQRDILAKSKWGLKIVSSDTKVIFGKYARTMICSNLFPLKTMEKVEPPKVETNLCSICGANYTGFTYEEHEQRPFHQRCLT